MKLVRNAVTEANPDLRGQKHHFTIENAPAAVLEAMDAMLEIDWANDTCPLYDEGFSCGYWVDLSEVECFKKAYKEAKAGVKAFMAAQAAPAEVEAAPVVTEAEAMQIAFFAGNDYSARRDIVEAAHAEALNMEAARELTARQARFIFHNTHAERLEAIAAAHAEAFYMNDEYEARAQFARLSTPHQAAIVAACHDEALRIDAAPVPAADIDGMTNDDICAAIDAEDNNGGNTYRRAYCARYLTRMLATYAARGNATDHHFAGAAVEHCRVWGIIEHHQSAELCATLKAPGDYLATVEALRDALLTGDDIRAAVLMNRPA
ncbi:DUF5417 domain-containing protein [Atlantibacter hermannii]|uniref:DUF5417 domain-containing protein n=1 Tax=Atlantibacter hermannii TaxID=565 RepID=UPI0032472698